MDNRKEKALAKARKNMEEQLMTAEQQKYQLNITKQRLMVDITNLTREKDFKEIQLKTDGGIVERNESRFYQGSTFVKDDIKPRFILKNEIDTISQMLSEKEGQLKELLKKEEENKNEPETPELQGETSN